MTPLQGALIAATVANGGKQMRPYLVQQLLGPDRTDRSTTATPQTLRDADRRRRSRATCSDMMVSVVENGTGKNAQINGFKVGGKTGTAQNAEGADDHGWFIGFAYDEDGKPISAVVRHAGERRRHASAEAARIGGHIMKAAAGRGGKLT